MSAARRADGASLNWRLQKTLPWTCRHQRVPSFGPCHRSPSLSHKSPCLHLPSATLRATPRVSARISASRTALLWVLKCLLPLTLDFGFVLTPLSRCQVSSRLSSLGRSLSRPLRNGLDLRGRCEASCCLQTAFEHRSCGV